jgi:hypothetical protein
MTLDSISWPGTWSPSTTTIRLNAASSASLRVLTEVSAFATAEHPATAKAAMMSIKRFMELSASRSPRHKQYRNRVTRSFSTTVSNPKRSRHINVSGLGAIRHRRHLSVARWIVASISPRGSAPSEIPSNANKYGRVSSKERSSVTTVPLTFTRRALERLHSPPAR